MNRTEHIQTDYNSLIVGYLTDSITEEERRILLEWIESDKVNKSHFNSLSEAWIIAGAEKAGNEYDSISSWEELNKLISDEKRYHAESVKRSFGYKYLRVAASWLIFFTLGLTAMYFIKAKPENLALNKVIISVPLGARSDVVLPDGSRVWLNAGTQITYNPDYGTKTRSLVLTGEAYFEVAKDKDHPFIVNASELKIVALGTKFNVKAYPEENNVLATLEEGKIDVQLTNSFGETTSTVLMPNENVEFHKSGMSLEKSSAGDEVKAEVENKAIERIEPVTPVEFKVIKNVNTQLFTSWKDERWIIENEPLGTLAPMLERRFNVKIIFTDEELKKNNFTGIIQNETIEQLMTAFKFTAPINFEINKDTVLLKVDTIMRDQFRHITRTK
jgi:transmembrane sensor